MSSVFQVKNMLSPAVNGSVECVGDQGQHAVREV